MTNNSLSFIKAFVKIHKKLLFDAFQNKFNSFSENYVVVNKRPAYLPCLILSDLKNVKL